MASPVMHEVTKDLGRKFSLAFDGALGNLECVERNCVLTSFSKDQIKTIKLDLMFLDTIFQYEDAHHLIDENLMDLLKTIYKITVEAKLCFSVARHDGAHQVSFDPMFRDILENIEVIKAQARDHYLLLLFSSSGYRRMDGPRAKAFISVVLKNMKTLLRSKADYFSPLTEEFEGLDESLRFLNSFLNEKELSDPSSQIAVVDHMALAFMHFYLLLDRKLKITTACVGCREKLTLHLSRLLRKMETVTLELNDIFSGFKAARKAINVSFDYEEIQKDLVRKIKSLSVSRLQGDVKLIYEEGIDLDFEVHKTEKICCTVHPFDIGPLQCLEWQESHRNIMSHQFHHILDKLKLLFGYVQLCREKLIQDPSSFGRKDCWYMLYEVGEDMHAVCIAIKYGMFDGAYFHLSRVELHVYHCLHVNGYNYILSNNEAVVELLGSLLGNLQLLLSYFERSSQEQIEILVKKLRFLRDVVNFVSEEKLEQDIMCSSFLNQIKTVCIKSISFSRQFYIIRNIFIMQDDMSRLIEKINEIEKEVKEISFNEAKIAAQSSNSEGSVMMIKLVMVATYFVQEDFGKLLNRKSSWMIPLKSRIETLHKGMKLIWGFSKRLPEQFTEHQEFNNLFTSIAAFVIKTRSLMAKEIDAVLLDFLILAMKLISAQFTLILNSKAILRAYQLQEQVDTLHTGLKFLITYLIDLPRQYINHEKHSHTLIEVVASEAEDVVRVHYTNYKECKGQLHILVIKIKLIHAKVSLGDILNCKTSDLTVQLVMDGVGTLLQEFEFLEILIVDLPNEYYKDGKLNNLVALVGKVATEARSIISSICNVKEMDVREMHQRILGLLGKIAAIKMENRENFLKVSRSRFPKPYIMDFVEFLIGKLKYILQNKPDLISSLGNEIQSLQVDLDFLITSLRDISTKHNRNEELTSFWAHVLNVADTVQNALDSFISSKDGTFWKDMLRLCITEINLLKMEVTSIVNGRLKQKDNNPLLQNVDDEFSTALMSRKAKALEMNEVVMSFEDARLEKKENNPLLQNVDDEFSTALMSRKAKALEMNEVVMSFEDARLEKKENNPLLQNVDDEFSTALMSRKANALEMNEVVVGFEDEEAKIKEKLMDEHSELDVISIVGMPGLGKTTLAKKIYNYYSKANQHSRHFDVCSSCCVSQSYEKKELLLDLLSKSFDNLEELRKKSEGNLSAILQNSLKGNRFLIFMDDIWSNDAWDDLKALFPKENNRSRIILTTRLEKVASYATEYSKPYHLRLFRPDESWSLLQQKLFQNEICPEKLEDVGKIIAEKCRGLPLSVVLIAGLLQEAVNERHWWESVAKSFSSHINTSFKIVELSYKHLPPYLKPCFLYFGGFQEDEEVSVSKLIWLWMAEGFIRVRDDQAIRSSELAQNYLMDLVGRSLVMKSKIAYDGKIKTCRVHDLIHEFCRKKAREENFLLRINGDYHIDSPHCYSKEPAQRCLLIFSSWETFEEWKPSKSPVCSLTVKVTSNDKHRLKNHEVSSILQSFNLLRVLDLRCIYMSKFPEELHHLNHLIYLAVQTGSNSIPPSIANLWNLQTFLFKGQRGEVCLPESLWNMVHLKNVHINDRASLGQHKYRPEFFKSSGQLTNLETFSTPSLSYGDDTEKIITRLSNLRKLKCRFSESWTSWGYSKKLRKKCYQFPVLNNLCKLESLKVLYDGRQVRHPCEFNFPSNLKKLTLSNFRLRWSEISKLGALQNLEVLKLVFKAFEGEKWEVMDVVFPKLKFLKLESLNLVRWIVSIDDAFPCLEQLVLIKCKEIKEMPTESLEDNNCLCSIEVKWCSRSAAICAKEIQEKKKELGGDGFRILILPPDRDSRT